MEIEYEHISVKALILWEVFALIFAFIGLNILLWLLTAGTWLWYFLLWLYGAIVVLICFLYLPLTYYNMEYAILKDTVVYKRGVILPNTQIMYRDRIAFVSVYKNPLTPILKLSSLVISAAGGKIRILFIDSDRADEIAEILSKKKHSFKSRGEYFEI